MPSQCQDPRRAAASTNMVKEIRTEVVVAIVIAALALVVVLGLRYVNQAEGNTGSVGSVVTEIQNNNPKGLPRVSEEQASGDAVMMGGPPRGGK